MKAKPASTAAGDVYEVFAKFNLEEPLRHVGVYAPGGRAGYCKAEPETVRSYQLLRGGAVTG